MDAERKSQINKVIFSHLGNSSNVICIDDKKMRSTTCALTNGAKSVHAVCWDENLNVSLIPECFKPMVTIHNSSTHITLPLLIKQSLMFDIIYLDYTGTLLDSIKKDLEMITTLSKKESNVNLFITLSMRNGLKHMDLIVIMTLVKHGWILHFTTRYMGHYSGKGSPMIFFWFSNGNNATTIIPVMTSDLCLAIQKKKFKKKIVRKRRCEFEKIRKKVCTFHQEKKSKSIHFRGTAKCIFICNRKNWVHFLSPHMHGRQSLKIWSNRNESIIQNLFKKFVHPTLLQFRNRRTKTELEMKILNTCKVLLDTNNDLSRTIRKIGFDNIIDDKTRVHVTVLKQNCVKKELIKQLQSHSISVIVLNRWCHLSLDAIYKTTMLNTLAVMSEHQKRDLLKSTIF
jgi:hypothetical protein